MDIRERIIEARAATVEDSETGRAIFYIPEARSKPYSMGRPFPLPAKIILPDEDNYGQVVQIVQAEIGDNGDILLGWVSGQEEGICMLGDVEVL
jgi:hypothetical protein